MDEAIAVSEWEELRVERRTVGRRIVGRRTVGPVIEEWPQQRLTMTVEQAATARGISRATAYEAASRGEIPATRIGRRILIPKVALEKLLAGETATAACS